MATRPKVAILIENGEATLYGQARAIAAIQGVDLFVVTEDGYGDLCAVELAGEEWANMPAKAKRAVSDAQ